MKEVTNDLASLNSSLNLGSGKMPIEEDVQKRKLSMHSTTWMCWWIWHGVEKSIWGSLVQPNACDWV